MSFNTTALFGSPLIPVPRSERDPEPFQARHRRSSTAAHVTSSHARRVALAMPHLDGRSLVQPHGFNREYACMWDDIEVQNDWIMAAREQENAYQLQVERDLSYKKHARERKHRKHASFDTERGRRTSVDRKREGRVSVERKHDLRVSADRERDHYTSTGRRHRHGSISSIRPPVSAVSFKPPTKCRYTRRLSFDHPTVHDSSRSRQYPIYILSPPAPAPEIYFPSQRRDRSVDAVRRFPLSSTEVRRFEKPAKPSGLARFNPFNMLRTVSISTVQANGPTNRHRRRSTAGRG